MILPTSREQSEPTSPVRFGSGIWYWSSLAVAPRAKRKGFMRLSLVTCPVALYPARSEFEKISFNQLNLLALVSTVSMLADGVKAQGP
jgi:hypothetical protein